MRFFCPACRSEYPIDGPTYHCSCGGLFSAAGVEPGKGESISLGEVETPILRRGIDGVPMLLKLDFLMPSGSFKDRGARFMMSVIAEAGITEVVEDSSGNAGAAVAAYSAAAGISCRIFVPESTSPGKTRQIEAYGARLVRVPGSRDATAEAVRFAAASTYYASHVYNPLFFEGTATLAKELYRRLGIPEEIFVPVGNGTLLLGLHLGFKRIGRLPRFVAVQAASCAPIEAAWRGRGFAAAAPTVAEGIAVGKPARIHEIIAAVHESGGEFVTVADEGVVDAVRRLAAMGIYVEPTSGAAVAAAVGRYRARPHEAPPTLVVPLTGSGLKKG